MFGRRDHHQHEHDIQGANGANGHETVDNMLELLPPDLRDVVGPHITEAPFDENKLAILDKYGLDLSEIKLLGGDLEYTSVSMRILDVGSDDPDEGDIFRVKVMNSADGTDPEVLTLSGEELLDRLEASDKNMLSEFWLPQTRDEKQWRREYRIFEQNKLAAEQREQLRHRKLSIRDRLRLFAGNLAMRQFDFDSKKTKRVGAALGGLVVLGAGAYAVSKTGFNPFEHHDKVAETIKPMPVVPKDTSKINHLYDSMTPPKPPSHPHHTEFVVNVKPGGGYTDVAQSFAAKHHIHTDGATNYLVAKNLQAHHALDHANTYLGPKGDPRVAHPGEIHMSYEDMRRAFEETTKKK